MINERIQAGADVARVMMSRFRPGGGRMRPEEMLRSFALAALDIGGFQMATEFLWREGRWMVDAKTDPSGMIAVLDVLGDRDIFGPQYESGVREWVAEKILQSAFESPEVLDYIEKAWKIEYTPELAQQLWRNAMCTNDYPQEAARRLLQRVPTQSVSYLKVVDRGGVSQAAAAVFAEAMSDSDLADAIDAMQRACEHGPADEHEQQVTPGVAIAHLMVLTREHAKRFGPDASVAKGLFERMDRFIDHRSFITKQAAAELAQLALAGGVADSQSLACNVILGGHRYLSGEELAALLKAGMPQSYYGSHRYYLLNEVESSKRRVVADAMTPEQRDDYMRNGIQAALAKAVHGRQGSLVDEDMIDFLHSAGFELGRTDYVTDTKAPCWLHECVADERLQRFAFAKLHVLGVLPQDLQFAGHGPLNYAAFRDDVKAIDALVNAGYDIEAKSSAKAVPMEEWKRRGEVGFSPLLIAAKYERDSAAKRLLQLGADVAVKSDSGMSVVQLTKSAEIKSMVKDVKAGRPIEGDEAPSGGGPKIETSGAGL